MSAQLHFVTHFLCNTVCINFAWAQFVELAKPTLQRGMNFNVCTYLVCNINTLPAV